MDHYAGIDVSLEYASVCIVDASGKIVREGKVASEPAALTGCSELKSKLAVIVHRMLADAKEFNPAATTKPVAAAA
jgi:predicted NBD/HSP70 family sugar kinase